MHGPTRIFGANLSKTLPAQVEARPLLGVAADAIADAAAGAGAAGPAPGG